MLIEMADRGRDSAGIAIYGDEVDADHVKLTLQHEDLNYDWSSVVGVLEAGTGAMVDWFQNAGAVVVKIEILARAKAGAVGARDCIASGSNVNIFAI